LDGQLFSQTIQTVISDDFDTEIYDFGRLSDGKWIFAVKLSPIPNALSDIRLALILTDAEGRQLKTISFNPVFGAERYEISDLFILPDDDFIVIYRGGDCDSDNRSIAVQKMDTIGHVFWANLMGGISGQIMTEDGNLLGLQGKKIKKVSTVNGETIWEYKIRNLSYQSIILVPGTEDFIIGNEEGLKYFEKVLIEGTIAYKLKTANYLNSGYLTGLKTFGNGIFYALRTKPGEIIRFRTDLKIEPVIKDPDTYSFFPTSNGIVLVKSGYQAPYRYSMYDSLGVKIDSVKIDPSGIYSKISMAYTDGMGVAGSYVSAINYDAYPDFNPGIGRRQGFFNFYPSYHDEVNPNSYSLSIKDILINDSFQVSSFYSPGPDYEGDLYNITGGSYNVKIANTGSQPVDSFWVNTTFDELTNYWFCPPTAATAKKYVIPKLWPGDTTWVEFGDFYAMRQQNIPSHLCFWTSGPANHPDDVPGDDLFCLDISKPELYDPEKLWTEATFINGKWNTQKFKLDTTPVVLQGKTYYELNKSFSETSDPIFYTGYQLRESEGIVYYYTSDGEKILYDYHLIEGDTFPVNYGDEIHYYVVDQLDTIQLLNGILKKRWMLEALDPVDENSEANHVTWIEDIGNISGFRSNINAWVTNSPYSTMLCMYWDSIQVYDDPEIEGCWLKTTSLSEINSNQINIYPNPATTKIAIAGYEGQVEDVKVFDTKGILMYTGKNNTIEINEFPPGFYYTIIRLSNSRVKTAGFIKI
jgi:hypothetical protein